MTSKVDYIFKAYKAGVDYGLYLAELERVGEDFYDAVQCSAYSGKMNMPSAPAQRRQLRSKAWMEQMGNGYHRFLDLVKQAYIEEGRQSDS